MKIRTDFVTNSSSSSFILAFANKECVEDVLKSENTRGEYETILDDVMNNSISKSLAIYEFREESYWSAMRYVAEKHDIDIWDFDDEGEYKSEIEDRLDELTETYSKKLEGFGYLAYVTYSDEAGESELEHEIVPQLSCTVARFSHH